MHRAKIPLRLLSHIFCARANRIKTVNLVWFCFISDRGKMVKRSDVASAPRMSNGVRKKSLKRNTNTFSKTIITDMNDDCLTSVFEYLDTLSLMKLTKTNERLKDIVTERVIPKKMVQFDDIRRQASTCKVLELFGPSMTRISIASDDIQIARPGYSTFAEFLRLLTVYGTPGKLQQLSISGFVDTYQAIPPGLLDTVVPYLVNVHTLSIDVPKSSWWLQANGVFNQFMEHMPKHNLRQLIMHNVRHIGSWLSVASLPNLRSLHICMCGEWERHNSNRNTNVDRLKAFIQGGPRQLTVFDYTGYGQESLLVEASKHIPTITQIGMIKNSMVYEQHTDESGTVSNWNKQGYRAKWKYLNDFVNLKRFCLESHAKDFENCGEIFRVLAGRNTVERLELLSGCLHQSGDNPVQFEHLRQMTNVHSLRLVDFGRLHSDEFVGQLFENLSELRECTIDGSQLKQGPIINLVQTGRNLRQLNMKSFTPKFYKKLVKIRAQLVQFEPNLKGQPLVIRVPKDIVAICEEELSNRTYKPAIVSIKPM